MLYLLCYNTLTMSPQEITETTQQLIDIFSEAATPAAQAVWAAALKYNYVLALTCIVQGVAWFLWMTAQEILKHLPGM